LVEHVLRFQPHGKKATPRPGASLLELAIEAGVSIESVCGGTGKCGKCRVTVAHGSSFLSAIGEGERSLLGDVSDGSRLACMTRVLSCGDIVIHIPEESRRGHHRLLAAGEERKVKLKPALTKAVLALPEATLQDVRADEDRLMDALSDQKGLKARMANAVYPDLPKGLREQNWTVTATVYRDEEIIRIEPGDTADRLHAVAVDIGTTKVVAYLLDLNTGKVLDSESMPNPQIPYGEDVMSRITYSSREQGGLENLQSVILEGLNSLISSLCEGAGMEEADILEVLVVGNTAMHHLFFGIPAKHLATAPYAPVVRSSMTVNAEDLRVRAYPSAKVSALPNIAGFVGADAVSDLLASGLYRDSGFGMMIDIGTNTEIIAGNKDRLMSCSCASGPAFEGAHIRHGMRASSGAIERVWIDPSTRDVRYRTVDDSAARGICGSGIVDAVAEMFKAGIVDHAGKLRTDGSDARVRKAENGSAEFVLAEASESANGKDITVAQHDVEEIQLAKAAIFTGVSVLMGKFGVSGDEITTLYAAGAFGTYVDAGSAIAIGMYPDIPTPRIKFIGNAAGAGARMALKSVSMRSLAERLSKKVEYVELAAEPNFQKEFAKAMFLPHRDRERFPSAMRKE